MKILITTLNSKYIHINNSVYIIDQYIKEPCDIKTFTIKDTNQKIISDITTKSYDFYFFSIYVFNISKSLEVIKELRKLNPNCKIIVGGPEVSYDFEYLLEFVDFVYLGEVNNSVNEIIENNITSKHIVHNINQSYSTNYNTTMHDISYYKNIPFSSDKIAYIETSKGCPYKCSYCMSSLENSVIYYELDEVYQIIDLAIKSQTKTIKFLDRTFNINEERTIKIINYIKNNAFDYQSFQFEIAPEIISDKFLHYLKTIDSSIFRFEIGIQSIYDQTINAVDRYQSYESYSNTLKALCSETNIITHLDLIAGLPFETLDQFINSFNETFKLQTDEYQLGVLKILNGTKIKKEVDIHKIKYDLKPPYTIIENKYISKQELKMIHDVEDIVDRFYNSNKFKKTFSKIICKYDNCFEVLSSFHRFILSNNFVLLHYQLHDIFSWFYKFLSGFDQDLKDYVIYDYLLCTKNKPKKFYETLSKEERNSVLKSLESNTLSLNYIHKYIIVEKLYLGKNVYVIKDTKLNTVIIKDINDVF